MSRSAIRSRGSLFIPLSASQRIQPLRTLQRIHLSCLSFPGILQRARKHTSQQLLHSLGWTRIDESRQAQVLKCFSHVALVLALVFQNIFNGKGHLCYINHDGRWGESMLRT